MFPLFFFCRCGRMGDSIGVSREGKGVRKLIKKNLFLYRSQRHALSALLSRCGAAAGKDRQDRGRLAAGSPSGVAPLTDAFRQGLRQLGYVEGKNIVIEYRYAEGKFSMSSRSCGRDRSPQG